VSARLAVVMSGFPRTSETFAVAELLALSRAGMLTRLYATKPGDGAPLQPGADELLPLLRVLPEGDVRRQAAVITADLRDVPVDGLHGYFAHQPAAVAAEAAAALGVGFSFSVHALDARKVPADELGERARAAAGVIACNTDVAAHVDVPGARLCLLSHGVDLDRFRPQPHPRDDGRLRVLAVGRLVEKKGFDTLVAAVARLDVPVSLRIVGTGPQQTALRESVVRHRLDGRVELVGRRSHGELPAEYAWSDVVAVPSVVDSRGDRDGLPNVVLEAMAGGRPVVASDVSALGPSVRAAGSGLVVPAGDPAAIARALRRLTSSDLRGRLGAAGRWYVEEHHDVRRCAQRFVDHLDTLHARAAEVVDA
jgi:glycosyltransferase involved in cell wall biosynthesis